MADPVQQQQKAQKRAQALRRNLSRRKDAAQAPSARVAKESEPHGNK